MRRTTVLALFHQWLNAARLWDEFAAKARYLKQEGHEELHDAFRRAEHEMRALEMNLHEHVEQHEDAL